MEIAHRSYTPNAHRPRPRPRPQKYDMSGHPRLRSGVFCVVVAVSSIPVYVNGPHREMQAEHCLTERRRPCCEAWVEPPAARLEAVVAVRNSQGTFAALQDAGGGSPASPCRTRRSSRSTMPPTQIPVVARCRLPDVLNEQPSPPHGSPIAVSGSVHTRN